MNFSAVIHPVSFFSALCKSRPAACAWCLLLSPGEQNVSTQQSFHVDIALYLRRMASRWCFPLTNAGRSCDRPVLTFQQWNLSSDTSRTFLYLFYISFRNNVKWNWSLLFQPWCSRASQGQLHKKVKIKFSLRFCVLVLGWFVEIMNFWYMF